mmetsp:Transcript_7893/g.13961  ORF Transcript_7893/g.13961 Transcript_7893/m.13961 type:complete len:234 (+) Transcript_7893:95-796(+)|eukprot:CAMPEP_0184521044 /NCGR_PEP_ID=MMETSP0198_2-20121128/7498_1 /TAXON_ID=1112570 /ORGANISM="Thraustochytrium sp., Strain LLF1b" /LENGTH=233 /DNA_ID=CAMNT_0026911697 /DNA_START=60 /DNA_END=761 /DNA_ORIENTATION=-
MATQRVTRRSAASTAAEDQATESVPAATAAQDLPSLRHEIGLADFVTMGNAMCGMSVVFLCLNYLVNQHYAKYMGVAFALFPLALFFDLIDGWVARKRYSSPFGGDLDSLADLISFGVAPATLGFTLGLRGIWDSVILVVFVVCGLMRLARYNVTSEFLSDASGKVKYYEGVPIPGSLLLVAALCYCWFTDQWGTEGIPGGQLDVYPGHFHPFSLLFLLMGLLLVSQVPIPKP